MNMYPEYIILHHSYTRDQVVLDAQTIRKNHKAKGWVDAGYHFFIEKVNDRYEIISARMMDSTGAHCIENRMNHKSIGICLIGDFDYKEPEKEQWDLTVTLVKSLCYLLDIPRKNVKGHRDYASYKSCPGRMFDMAKFRNELK